MFRVRRNLALLLSVSAFLSSLPHPAIVKAQDLVASEDIAGGSSVFVFRESRKKRQSKSADRREALADHARSGRSSAQIAASAQKRRQSAIAARNRAAVVAAANRKIRLSNTLTAK